MPINANLANTPKEIPAGMLNCVLSCIIAIECVIKQGGLVIDSGDEMVNFHSKCKMVRRSFGVLQQSIPVPSSSRGPFPAGCLYGIFPS